MKVSYEPGDDRSREGTKVDRGRQVSPAVKRRYAIVMAALLTLSIGVWIAIRNTDRLSAQAGTLKGQARTLSSQAVEIASLERSNRALLDRVARDEHATCVIQARGLPAGHDLAASMGQIHALLTLPTTAADRQAAASVPAPELAREQAILASLNAHLAAYTRLEAKQPRTRKC